MKRSLAGLGPTILAASVLATGLGLAAPALAADDGYANVFSSVLGATGLIKPDAPPEIEYRERPPLVLPPQQTLPKPVAGEAKRTAAWPQDPDVVRRRKAAEEARAPIIGVGDHAEVLSAAELAKGRAEGQPAAGNPCGPKGNSRGCLVVSPDELRAEGDRAEASNPTVKQELTAGQEPDRVYLTQPPKGYMRPTKTVKATAEAPDQRIDPANPRSFTQPAKKEDE